MGKEFQLIPVVLSPLHSADTALLERATLANMKCCGPRFHLSNVQELPELALYTRIDPARGDFGVVEATGGRPVGVAWAQFLPESTPGYGFVDTCTLEVSLWVEQPDCGGGLSRTLLRAVIAESELRRLPRSSLSVEPVYQAKKLYLFEEFSDWPAGADGGVMIAQLPPTELGQ